MSSIIPFTATCMACTIPVDIQKYNDSIIIIENNENITYVYDDYKNMYIPKKNEKAVVVFKNYNYDIKKDKYVKKFRKLNSSKNSRKFRKIHQPGRTNCSQRYQCK